MRLSSAPGWGQGMDPLIVGMVAHTQEQFWREDTLQVGSPGLTTVSWHLWTCG